MSYILDALRKADAERERGSVPGLRAQPVPPVSADAAPPTVPRSMLWTIGGLSFALLAALAWRGGVGFALPGPFGQPVDATPAPAAARAPALNIEAAIGVPKPAPVAQAPKTTQRQPAQPPAAPGAAAPSTPALVPAATAVPAPPAARDAAAPQAPVAAQPVAAAAPQAAASSAVLALSDLPDGIRRELPTLAFGGSIYSEQPVNRFVIINGQTFREREQVTPGLVVEQIQLRGAVLGYKGYRYRVAF